MCLFGHLGVFINLFFRRHGLSTLPFIPLGGLIKKKIFRTAGVGILLSDSNVKIKNFIFKNV